MQTATNGHSESRFPFVAQLDRVKEVLGTNPWARFGIGIAVGIGVGFALGRLTASSDGKRHETITHAIVRAGMAAAAGLLVRNAIEKSAGARS